jgi:hypothetical protein
MTNTAEPMSLRAYSRHRGVSLRAVQKAIASERITTRKDGRINAEEADTQWTKNTAPRPEPGSTYRPAPAGARDLDQVEPRPEGGAVEYSRARAIREGYLARLSKLDYEERTNKLVSREQIEVEAFTRYRVYRDGMLNIPDRVAAVVAAESDAARVHDILSSEIRRALLEFSDAQR